MMFDSLAGLSVGDALGQQFPVMRVSVDALRSGTVPGGQWQWTDDTEMACGVVAELCTRGAIDRGRLAVSFARHRSPDRDYGFSTVAVLMRIGKGASWREVSGAAFGNKGSYGNGAAMRVAPLGAAFAGDPETIVAQAIRSAEVTHMHPEGISGAVAVALAAGQAAQARIDGIRPTAEQFLTTVLDHLDDSEVARGIRRARTLLGANVQQVATELGNGSHVSAQDTVPLTLWIAATHLHDYPAAITSCLTADGDIDTTAAIVGGIVTAHTGTDAIPPEWLAAREPLPTWLLQARAAMPRPSRLRRWFTGSRG
ncbi:ADP-ribosyl-[dinitrogen reductase] glycohydrolase [Nocardia sp. RB20]|uniref:ADP-ribosyl-[dinitrogen reductase] glycohydrolase n=2 Tax=Nocardia macrotermitis TaxID=2585198 RepID=A0A7K0D3X1_9NOCA|nr:ADP-ribosyl-[dinitrogen reductase] glycohydrolase [Nocardia macrotermitis]